MTIKVNKEKLVNALKAKKAELDAKIKAQETEAAKHFIKERDKSIANTVEYLAVLKKAKSYKDLGKYDPTNYTTGGKTVMIQRLFTPNADDRELAKIERAIKALSLSDEEFINLNDQKNSDYLSLI